MARVLVIGLEANHAGKFDVEKIMQLSPPVEPVISAVNSALNLAYHGMEALPENPPTAAAKILSRILSGISLRKHGKQPAAGD